MLVVGNNEQFGRLCQVLGQPQLSQDDRFGHNIARVRNLKALNALLEPLLAARTAQHWVEALEAVGVPCGVINTMDEVFAHPQVIAREMVVSFPESESASPPSLANPLRFSETPVRYRLPPPALGEHTHEVLSDLLKMDKADIDRLSVAALSAPGKAG